MASEGIYACSRTQFWMLPALRTASECRPLATGRLLEGPQQNQPPKRIPVRLIAHASCCTAHNRACECPRCAACCTRVVVEHRRRKLPRGLRVLAPCWRRCRLGLGALPLAARPCEPRQTQERCQPRAGGVTGRTRAGAGLGCRGYSRTPRVRLAGVLPERLDQAVSSGNLGAQSVGSSCNALAGRLGRAEAMEKSRRFRCSG